MAIFYEWYVLGRNRTGRETKRKLRWRMTQDRAIAWAAANPGKPLEMVPNSGEDRGEATGPYLGWGQAGLEGKPTMGMEWPPKPKDGA